MTIRDTLNFCAGLPKGFASLYKLLGISPYFATTPNGEVKINRAHRIIICFLIFVYWIGIGWSVFYRDRKNSLISICSNNIQLIVNAIAFSVALINPLWRFKKYHEILRLFDIVDQQLHEIHPMIFSNDHKTVNRFSCAFLLYLSYLNITEFILAVVNGNISPIYWFLYSIPLVFYSMSIHQVTVFIFGVYTRFKKTSKLLQQEKISVEALRLNLCECSSRHEACCTQRRTEEKREAALGIISDLGMLCDKLNYYYGPVLLSTLGAIFAVTSVQTFYTIAIPMESYWEKFPLGMIVRCVSFVIMNVFLVVSLCFVTEKVYTVTHRLLWIVIREQKKEKGGPDLDMVQPILSRINFSAHGFFQINYNMLFGFVSALITYLIILIQFNQLSKPEPRKIFDRNSDQEALPGPGGPPGPLDPKTIENRTNLTRKL